MSGPVAERLAALAVEHGLGPGQISRLDGLLAALAKMEWAWTAVRDPPRAVDVHVADALSALPLRGVREARAAVDIGSGAGFPGLPLAVALPRTSFVLLESVARRCEAIQLLRAGAGINNARAVCERAETWTAGVQNADLVTARALAPLSVICEYAAPLLRVGGVLVAWKGARDGGEEADGAAAAGELGLELREVVRSEPYPGCVDHHLHTFAKLRETPSAFPRRPGIARKRPLGVSR